MATRNRVIYQSEALYVGQPEATGHHITAKSNNASDANGDDVSSKVWGLVKEPDNITKKCILDNTDFWSLITKPTDLVDAGGSPVAPFKGDFDAAEDYEVEDVVKVTDDGKDWFFEADQASGPATAVKTPLVALADFTDNGNYKKRHR